MHKPIYLDYAATTPLDPEVREVMLYYFDVEYGNAGSRTHLYGQRANAAVNKAREQIANVVDASSDEVIFTSGATESNNLAILGLEKYARTNNKYHIVSTAIEHKAVLEPLEELGRRGFEVTLVSPEKNGRVSADKMAQAIRPDTFLVSMMHANNETGTLQPVEELADFLSDNDVFFHVDAAQSFGKLNKPLQNSRIDLISASSHKIYGPMGVGCLIARKRRFKRPPISPLLFGGGQERGLRPGTLPVPLIVGFGKAAELAFLQEKQRAEACKAVRYKGQKELQANGAVLNGCNEATLPNILNASVSGIDSEAAMLALKELVAISNGSACTSIVYTPSHVLEAMDIPIERIKAAIRFSWGHRSKIIEWREISKSLNSLKSLKGH